VLLPRYSPIAPHIIGLLSADPPAATLWVCKIIAARCQVIRQQRPFSIREISSDTKKPLRTGVRRFRMPRGQPDECLGVIGAMDEQYIKANQ